MALLWSGMETTPALAAPGYSLCTHRETTDCVRVTGGRRSKVGLLTHDIVRLRASMGGLSIGSAADEGHEHPEVSVAKRQTWVREHPYGARESTRHVRTA